MAEFSFPFAVVASGDRTVTAASFGALLAGLRSRGILEGRLNESLVTESSPAAMSVDVDTGMAYVGKDEEQRFYRNTASLTLTIDAADPGDDRWDLIVLEMDYNDSSDRAISATVVKGTPAGSPSDPSLTQDEDKYQMSIARVVVGAGVTTILDANIADLRPYAGWPSDGAIAHGLTDEAETETWFTVRKTNSAEGGAILRSIAEDAAVSPVTVIESFGGTATTTKSTAGRALIEVYASEHDGSNALANIAADGNVFGVRARVGGADVTRWMVDEDGDTWQSGTATAVTVTTSGQIEGTTGNGYLDMAGDSGASVKLRLTDAGLLLLGDTTNANMTVGLTLQQGANDNEIAAFKSSDVGHGLTGVAETDTFGTISKSEATAGGLALTGLKDNDVTAGYVVHIAAYLEGNVDTTFSTSGVASVVITGSVNGGAMNADGNILGLRRDPASGTAMVWLADEDGDTWQLGSIFVSGDGSNANMTLGITIDQGANDDEILAFKSSDVGHGMTNIAEADTWANFQKRDADAGGLEIAGFRDADSTANGALVLLGYLGENAATSGTGIIRLGALVKSGAGASAVNAGGIILTIENNVTPIWTIDAEGDVTMTGDLDVAGNLDVGDVTMAGNLDVAGNFISLTEMAAPGAGAANTARIYAFEGAGDALTDLVAVFQDGSLDVFAQETTDPGAAQFRYPSGTELRTILRKPHPGIVQVVGIFPDGSEMMLKEHHYHDDERIGANLGTEAPLPAGW